MDIEDVSIRDASRLVLHDSLKYFGISEISSLTVWVAISILNLIAGTGEVGLYLVAGFVLSAMGEFSRALTYVLFPYFSRSIKERKQEDIEDILVSSINFGFIMQLCIAGLVILGSGEICRILGVYGCEPLIITIALAAPMTFGYRTVIVDALMTGIKDFGTLYKLQILYAAGCIPVVLLLSDSLGGLAMVLALVSAWILTTIYATWKTFGRLVSFSTRRILEEKIIRIGLLAYALLVITGFWIPLLPLFMRLALSVPVGVGAIFWLRKFLKEF
jgi:O-antigen/teichoic acid export membrane protein